MKNLVYLDYQATTPLDKRVLKSMMPSLTNNFGNAHSNSHIFGWKAKEYVTKAREQIAKVINADYREIIFTSGATESNNLAIKGLANFNKNEKNHIITTTIEHKCVLETCKYLEMKDFNVTFLPVQKDGLIDLNALEKAITNKTILVSIMGINNEIGVIQPLKEIGKICKKHKVYFHTDCAQAFGKIPLDVEEMKIDLMSISGHKIYGPKGIGALYIRRTPRVRLEPIIHGGGQERGMRSGTLPVPLIVGLGKAAELAKKEMKKDYKHIKKLSERLYKGLMTIEKVELNGSREKRWVGNLNFSFAGIEGESLMMSLKDIALSSGSACSSKSLEPSYVITAIGTKEELAHSSIRFGLGKFTTKQEIDYTIKRISEEVIKLRKMSPIWEMMQKGVDLSKIKWKHELSTANADSCFDQY
jgi:cysteine desulfurase